MDKLYKIAAAHAAYFKNYHKYKMVFWDKFDYDLLSRNIMYYKKKGKYQKGTWNDVIIAADTETSKGHEITDDDEPQVNHVCAWTISIRAYHCNIVTLYGSRPSEMMNCIQKIREALKGDEMIILFHNLSYDYIFLRLFLIKWFGVPVKGLATKPYYPIYIKFDNGIIIKDSLILAGCKLEKWADDLNVKHKKAVGSWDYDLIRDQGESFSRSELHYIENDTLALAECIDAMCISLNKSITSLMPTATGIPRSEVQERGAKHNAHTEFVRKALDYDQYEKFRLLFHGGYCHANRFYIGENRNEGVTLCKDFVSSYPFCLMAFKYPADAFMRYTKDLKPSEILSMSDRYAFVFKFTAFKLHLKDDMLPMPALQASKCLTSIDMEVSNGRVLSAGYLTIYLTELDLEVIDSMYDYDTEYSICTEIELSRKDYLPRWFTDYIYEIFSQKCLRKKDKASDPVGYSLIKSRLNSIYGLTVQASVKPQFIEVMEEGKYKINEHGDTAIFKAGEYRQDFDTDLRKEYGKYLKNPKSVLNYQTGCYCTAYAFRNLFLLAECINKYYGPNGKLIYPPHHYYSDTDSIYSDDWNEEKVAAYNQRCKDLLLANGYGPVLADGKEYWPGIAENDSKYNEFVVLGAKRYCGRSPDDGKLHITVSGVPKKGAECLNDDISNFRSDFIFDGKVTGKLAHFHIFSDKGIYKDAFGNEIGDSIDLKPCDYSLDATNKYDYIKSDDYYYEYYDESEADKYDK